MQLEALVFSTWAFPIAFLATAILPSPSPKPPRGNALDCYNQAKFTNLTTDEAVQLCSGLDSLGPVRCYNRSRDLAVLTKYDAIRLCTCSPSTEPVDCFAQATRTTTLTTQEALQLCYEAGKYSNEAQNCKWNKYFP